MGDYGRFAFEPLLSLVHGRPVGVEIQRCLDRDRTELVAQRVVWGARQLSEFDTGIAIASVLHTTEYDSTVPVHVDLCADSVAAAPCRIAQALVALRDRAGSGPIPQLVLDIGPAVSAAPPAALAEGIGSLRAAGFGIALRDVGRGFGLDLVAELKPDLVKIDAALVARLPADPTAQVIVAALCEVCQVVGIRVAASGVERPEELAAVRDFGITWAQGPLLAAARRRATTAGILLPVELMPRIQAARAPSPTTRLSSLPTVASLARTPVVLSDQVTAEAVREAFSAHPQAGSVLLVDACERPTGFLDRNRFMIAISGPFGHALHANRRALTIADTPRTIGTSTDLATALEYCLADRTRSWDDLVLLDGSLTCAGIVSVTDLLQVATAAANVEVA